MATTTSTEPARRASVTAVVPETRENEHFRWTGIVNDKGVLDGVSGEMEHKAAKANAPSVRYVGQFKDGLPHGDGTLFYEFKVKGDDGKDVTGGYHYVGQWDEGKRHGNKGKLSCLPLATEGGRHTGDVYDGAWRNDRPNGEGSLTFGVKRGVEMGLNRNVKKGNWRAGFLPDAPDSTSADAEAARPRGTLLFFDGDHYEGEVAQSLPKGEGTYYFSHGGRYTGDWCWSAEDLTSEERTTKRQLLAYRTAKYAGPDVSHMRGVLLPLDCIACPTDDPTGGFDIVTWCRTAGIVGSKLDAIAKCKYPECVIPILDQLLHNFKLSEDRKHIDVLRVALGKPKLPADADTTRLDFIRADTLGE